MPTDRAAVDGDEVRQRHLSRLPDLPQWVETRDLLMQKNTRVIEHPYGGGFVVWSAQRGIASVVGEPEPHAIALAASEISELLAFSDNINQLRPLLPDFDAEAATIFSAPHQLPDPPPHHCRAIHLSEIAAQNHLPETLLAELADFVDDSVPLVAAFDGDRAVAFAYAASETESLWDISIDTIESYRRRGYAAAAALHLVRTMKARGKSAVWGALDSNPASANLARRLGFVENSRIWVMTRKM